jgi:Heparinase II/III-like protein
MEDLRRAEALEWDPEPDRPCFRGRHHGYERLPEPATHTRRIELDSNGATLHITDSVISAGEHDLQWTFPLAPCTAVAAGSEATAGFAGGATLEITVDGAELSVEDGWLSPSYGRRERAPFVRARKRSRPGDDVTTLTLRVSPARPVTVPAERRRPRGSVS